MEPSDFVKRLQATAFQVELAVLTDAELSFGAQISQLKGFHALSTAFKRFFLETIAAFNQEVRPKVTAKISAQHAQLVEKLVHDFQILRAAEVTAISGYPLQGYTLLRNVYDDCVLASGAMQGLTDFEELAGIKPGEPFDEHKALKNRKAT